MLRNFTTLVGFGECRHWAAIHWFVASKGWFSCYRSSQSNISHLSHNFTFLVMMVSMYLWICAVC